jgi:ribosomal RNA assembly protein
MQELSIPKLRIAVLIGTKGVTKKKIEKVTKTQISISKEGDVIIEGDSLDCFVAEKVVKAVGRGFNPEVALQLVNEDFVLEVINILDFTGKSEKKFTRIKARLIGTKGKAKQVMENLTNTNIVIYGKTVSIIGKFEDIQIAKEAVEYLLEGAPHGNVYNFVESAIKKRKW